MLRTLREWAIVLLLSLIAIEIAFQAAVRLGFVHFPLPSYSFANTEPFWRVLSGDFGVWHPRHATYRHRKTCFDVTYTSNSHGMRDAEVPQRSAQPRVAVIGDSFVEGWGIDYGRRFTERLEQLTKMEHLNFGASGSFGTTQAFLLYQTLAAKFDHQAVIFSILPGNDFIDDTAPTRELDPAAARRRPYLVGDYPNYEILRPNRFGSPRRWEETINTFLDEFWLTYSARQHVVELIRSNWARIRGSSQPPDTISFYYDYTPEQFGRLRYAIEQIKTAAGERPMLIFTVPLLQDYRRTAREGGTPPLTTALRELAAKLGIDYLDLLEVTRNSRWNSLFLNCDPHWSEYGHRVAAEELLKRHPLRKADGTQ